MVDDDAAPAASLVKLIGAVGDLTAPMGAVVPRGLGSSAPDDALARHRPSRRSPFAPTGDVPGPAGISLPAGLGHPAPPVLSIRRGRIPGPRAPRAPPGSADGRGPAGARRSSEPRRDGPAGP